MYSPSACVWNAIGKQYNILAVSVVNTGGQLPGLTFSNRRGRSQVEPFQKIPMPSHSCRKVASKQSLCFHSKLWRYQPDVITFLWHSASWVELQYICSGDRSGIGIRSSCYALESGFARLMSIWVNGKGGRGQLRQYWCGLEFFKASLIVQHKDVQKVFLVRTPLHFCLPGYTLASRPLPAFLFHKL